MTLVMRFGGCAVRLTIYVRYVGVDLVGAFLDWTSYSLSQVALADDVRSSATWIYNDPALFYRLGKSGVDITPRICWAWRSS